MERIFRRGLVAFRWGALLWMTGVFYLYWDTDYITHKAIAIGLIGAAFAITVMQTALVPASIRFVNRRRVAALELAVAISIMALDGYVRRQGVVFETGPTLGSWWPVAGLLSAATYLPLWASVIAGLLFGAARTVSVAFNGIPFDSLSGGQQLSLVNTGVFAALAAASVGLLMKLLRNAESEVALARAREELARTLHDGVLQTLAIVVRRTDDEQLAKLVRDQERELRRYLSDQRQEQELLAHSLREIAAKSEDVFGTRINVIVADDLPQLPAEACNAISGAIGEALTNAGKHANAQTITVYVEPDEESGVFASVKDDGVGFDPTTVQAGVGTTRSIKGRIEDAGGRVEVKSSPGHGTEVLIWLP